MAWTDKELERFVCDFWRDQTIVNMEGEDSWIPTRHDLAELAKEVRAAREAKEKFESLVYELKQLAKEIGE